MGSLGLKFKIKELIVSFTDIAKYINYMGVAVMLWLAFAAIQPENTNAIGNGISTVSLSVAADAAVICLYLSICGNNPVLLAFVSAILHSLFLTIGVFCGKHIFKEEWLIYTKYIAAVFFATMAVSKIIALHN